MSQRSRRQPPRKQSARRPASRPPGSGKGAARQPARPSGQAGQSGKSGQPAQRRPFLTPGASPFRQSVERRSALVLIFLRRLPRAVPGLLVLGVLAVGLLAPAAIGAVALLVVAAFLTWLVFLSWPSVPFVGRMVRLVVVSMVIAYAFVRLSG